MLRYDMQMQAFRRDKFRRVACAAVIGGTIGHLLPLSTTAIFIGIQPTIMLMLMDRFSMRELTKRCVLFLAGLSAGVLAFEMFRCVPILTILITYALFLGVIKFFAMRKEGPNPFNVFMTYSLGSIYSSYPDSVMEVSICQDYLIQVALLFFLVWGLFMLFPAQMPPDVRKQEVPPEFVIPDPELALYAAIWLGVWLVFMFFEWRFAFFAFISFVSAFRFFERRTIKHIARENTIAHVTGCTLSAVFCLLLLGMTRNVLLLSLGLALLVIPFVRLAVYPPREELRYRTMMMLFGVHVPPVLYLSTEAASVNLCLLRALLLASLMLILWFLVEYLYYGGRVAKMVVHAVPTPRQARFRLLRRWVRIFALFQRARQQERGIRNA